MMHKLKEPIKKTVQKAIVLQEHTLGVIMENGLQVLRASVLKGSPYEYNAPFDIVINDGQYRSATARDFKDFGVQFHPEYLQEIEVQSLALYIPVEKMERFGISTETH